MAMFNFLKKLFKFDIIDDEKLELKEVERLELKEGDIILLKSDRVFNNDQFERLKGLAKQTFPNNKIIFLDGGLELKILKMNEAGEINENT
jgi:hypothetical protein